MHLICASDISQIWQINDIFYWLNIYFFQRTYKVFQTSRFPYMHHKENYSFEALMNNIELIKRKMVCG